MRDPTPTFLTTLMFAGAIVLAHGLWQTVGLPGLPALASLPTAVLGGL